eukprot:sb/3467524/
MDVVEVMVVRCSEPASGCTVSTFSQRHAGRKVSEITRHWQEFMHHITCEYPTISINLPKGLLRDFPTDSKLTKCPSVRNGQRITTSLLLHKTFISRRRHLPGCFFASQKVIAGSFFTVVEKVLLSADRTSSFSLITSRWRRITSLCISKSSFFKSADAVASLDAANSASSICPDSDTLLPKSLLIPGSKLQKIKLHAFSRATQTSDFFPSLSSSFSEVPGTFPLKCAAVYTSASPWYFVPRTEAANPSIEISISSTVAVLLGAAIFSLTGSMPEGFSTHVLKDHSGFRNQQFV